MANKGICEIPLFDPILPKMDCRLFGVTTVNRTTSAVTETKMWTIEQTAEMSEWNHWLVNRHYEK